VACVHQTHNNQTEEELWEPFKDYWAVCKKLSNHLCDGSPLPDPDYIQASIQSMTPSEANKRFPFFDFTLFAKTYLSKSSDALELVKSGLLRIQLDVDHFAKLQSFFGHQKEIITGEMDNYFYGNQYGRYRGVLGDGSDKEVSHP
jgi:hypothetical protein